MSWEAWGTPPDPEPGPEPDPDLAVPQIGPRQQWCCAKGCGPCGVTTKQHVWREVHDLDGKLTEQNTTPVDVSACCSADLLLWDEDQQGFVAFELVVRQAAT